MKSNDTALSRWWRNWNRFYSKCYSEGVLIVNSAYRVNDIGWKCFIGYKDYDAIQDAKMRPEFIRLPKKKYGFKFILIKPKITFTEDRV